MPAFRNLACATLAAIALISALLPGPVLAALPPGPLAKPSPTPTATAIPTPTPTAVPAPSPSPTPQGQLNIDPPAAPPSAKLHITGTGFPAKASFALLFDKTVIDSATSDAAGNFSRDITVPADATGPDHQICAQQQFGRICGNFHLEPAPTPSPSPSPSPEPTASPDPTPSPSPSSAVTRDYTNPTSSGGSPFDSLTRPPGIFFPILLLLAAIIGGLYWFFVLREPAPVNEVTILHKAAPQRSGGFEAAGLRETPAPAPAPAPPPPAAPVVYESPGQPAASKPSPVPPSAAPGGADVPPDYPEPND